MSSKAVYVLPPSWSRTAQYVLLTVVGYIFLVILLRLNRKQNLSQTSPFSIILLVTLGTIFGASIAQGQISLVDGFMIIITLMLLVSVTNWVLTRHPKWRAIAESPPVLLFHQGQFIREAMTAEHISEEDIRAEVRKTGIDDMKLVKAVYIESDGEYSVIPKKEPRTDVRPLD